jgi:hypothetical protein
VKEVDYPNKIGQIVSVSGNTVHFTSSKPLENGDVVWVMVPGWDYRYENRTSVPVARGVVQKSGITNTALIWLMPTVKQIKFTKNMEVFAPPTPEPVDGVGMVEFIGTGGGDVGRLVSESSLKKMDRFLAVQTIWDNETSTVIYDNVGYVVVTNPDTRSYVSVSNPKYSYAPIGADSILINVPDSDSDR